MSPKVVMVDDNAADQFLVRRALVRSGVDLDWLAFSRGDEFLSFLQRVKAGDEPFPILVLLDINMPGMSGLEVIDTVRADPALAGRLRIYVLSSSHDPQDAEQALHKGASRYVLKPSEISSYEEIFKEIAA